MPEHRDLEREIPLLVVDLYEAAGAVRRRGEKVGAVAGQSQSRWPRHRDAERIVHHFETVEPSELVTLTMVGSMPAPQSEKACACLYAEKVLPRVAHCARSRRSRSERRRDA